MGFTSILPILVNPSNQGHLVNLVNPSNRQASTQRDTWCESSCISLL